VVSLLSDIQSLPQFPAAATNIQPASLNRVIASYWAVEYQIHQKLAFMTFAQFCVAKSIDLTMLVLLKSDLIAIILAFGATHIIPFELFLAAAIVHATWVQWELSVGNGLLFHEADV